jgi:ubiquinone/menaquinone biosynthesis C-methylase UbiE
MKTIKRASVAVFAAVVLMLIGIARAEEHPQGPEHHRFQDTEHWVQVFESPERDRWQQPDEVVKALGLKPGETIVDLGAGTGYFTRRFAAAVAPNGRAIGLDVEPGMVDHMREDARERGLADYDARVVKPDDPGLAPSSVDVVFLCDAYHHIDDRPDYFRKVRAALKPGGRVVDVDFKKQPLPVGPTPAHKVAREQVIKEMQRAGYRLAREHDFLPYQYFLEFEPAPHS